MEVENNILDQSFISKPENDIKIYSSQAIYGFSFFCSTIFGGILLMQNLIAVGKKHEGYKALIFSILYSIFSICLILRFERAGSLIPLLANIGGASILRGYFFKRNFPFPENYGKKKIRTPLLIAIGLIALFIMIHFIPRY